jgi:hypothetical protein
LDEPQLHFRTKVGCPGRTFESLESRTEHGRVGLTTECNLCLTLATVNTSTRYEQKFFASGSFLIIYLKKPRAAAYKLNRRKGMLYACSDILPCRRVLTRACTRTRFVRLFTFKVRLYTIMANWTRLPGGRRLGGRIRQTKYNARTLVTSLPTKVTHITHSYTNNANRKHNNSHQSDTSYLLN